MWRVIRFTAYGTPQTKGSTTSQVVMRGSGNGREIVYKNGRPLVTTRNDNPLTKSWEGVVAEAAATAMVDAGAEIARGVPVRVEVAFFKPRPPSHYGTGRNAGVLRASAASWPAKRPDVDKLLRPILDAMTGIAYVDDGQIVEVVASKQYGAPERADVSVELLVSEPRRPTAADVGIVSDVARYEQQPLLVA